MSLNITSIANQYPDYAGYYLKAYDIETNKPKAIYFDDRKLSGALKVKLNKDGLFISDGGANIIPHVEGYYNLFVFKTKKEADENDFTNAISLGDRLIAEISGENITKASETEYGSIRFAKDNELFIGGEFPDSVAVESSKITRMGEISAEEQKAVEADLIARDDTKWLSPDDINYMITEFGAPNQEREQLKIGDTIWMDKETAKTRDDLLPQNNELFDPVEYPLLAAKSGYSQEGSTTVDGFSNPVKTSYFNTGVSTGSLIYVKISENLIYGAIYEDLVDTTGFNVFKSTDNMQTIEVLPVSQTGNASINPSRSTLVWDGGDYIYFASGGFTVSIFQISTETFTIQNYNMSNTGSPLVNGTAPIIHWNENLGKFITMNVREDLNRILIVEFENDPANRIVTEITTTGQDFQYLSPMIFPGHNSNYYNGLYYLYDILNYDLYTIDESTWTLTLLQSFTPTYSSNDSANVFYPIEFNKDGKMAFVLSYESSGSVEIAYSEDRINFTQYQILTGLSSFLRPFVMPFEDAWLFGGNADYSTFITKDFQSILYQKTDWSSEGNGNYMFYDYDSINNILKQYTSGSASISGNPIYLQTLDAQTTVTIGETRTLDMGYEAIGNIIPVVKAK